MNTECLDLSVKGGRWEWRYIVRKRAVICGLFTYATKRSARSAAVRILKSMHLLTGKTND